MMDLLAFAVKCIFSKYDLLCARVSKKTDILSDIRFFLVREAGLEFQESGIYGIFETFILIKHVFCLIYPIISNWIFSSYPVKGSGKGKNKGNTKVDIGILFV